MPFDLTQPDQASYYRSGYYRGYFALGPLPDLSQLTEEYRQATQLGFVGGTQKTKPLISVDLTPPQSKPAASPEKDPGETGKRLNQPGDNRVKPDTQEAMAWYRRGFEGDSATPPKVYAGWYSGRHGECRLHSGLRPPVRADTLGTRPDPLGNLKECRAAVADVLFGPACLRAKVLIQLQ